jgi:hypothetical protein
MSKGKVLVTGSNATRIEVQGGGKGPTGNYLNETVVPIMALISAGYDVQLATPNGAKPHMDKASDSAVHIGGDTSAYARAKDFWTDDSTMNQVSTLRSVIEETGSAAVNDPSATNVAQIVIGGTRRLTPDDALSMPSFGHAYSDDEIAAVANYVTARFGAKGSSLTARDVADLRAQVSN